MAPSPAKSFPGNMIPKTLFSAASQKALSVFQASGSIAPNNGAAPGTAAYISNNYLVTTGTQIYPVNKWSIKGDHVFNDKHRISGYYGYDREHQTPGPDGPPTLPGNLFQLQRPRAGHRRGPLQLDLDPQPHQDQPLLCGRQQLAPESQSSAGIHR